MVYELLSDTQLTFFQEENDIVDIKTKSNKRRKNTKNIKNIKQENNLQTHLNLDSVGFIEQKIEKPKNTFNTRMTNSELNKLLTMVADCQFAEILNNLELNRFLNLLSELDDNLIIKSIKNSEVKYLYKQEAMEFLYGKYEYLYGYAIYKAKLHIRRGEEDEYKQHGHLLMSRAIGSFNDAKGCSFKSFLYCVLYRGYISKYFQTDKYKFNEVALIPIVDGDDYATFDILLSDMIEENTYLQMETDALLNDLQEALTDIEYQCVMARISGLAYKDIAELTGLSIKQVDNRIQRIRKNKLLGL